MTTLCLCDWVETQEDKALRQSMQDMAQPVEDSDGLQVMPPPAQGCSVLTDWPGALL